MCVLEYPKVLSLIFYNFLFMSVTYIWWYQWLIYICQCHWPSWKSLYFICRQQIHILLISWKWNFWKWSWWWLRLDTLVDVHLNLLNSFHFLILEGVILVILINCMIFLSPFLDVTRMSMSAVSFLAQLDSGILCL